MSNLISGKEAKLAWANNKEIEYMPLNKWNLLGGSTPLSIFDRGDVKFRLKPRTITLNGVEVPAPFEPKDGVDGHIIDLVVSPVIWDESDPETYRIGTWRTEEEIKKVVEALRSVFK